MEPTRPISNLDWMMTPEVVKQYIRHLEGSLNAVTERVGTLEARTEKLETRVNQNSRNSSKPPSSDPPYSKQKRKQDKSKRKKGGQKGHPGHQQKMLAPVETKRILPERCSCGHTDFEHKSMKPFHTHQHVELPDIPMDVTHYVLNKCGCPNCGKIVKASLPPAAGTGYGPRFSAFIAELSGIKGMSRQDVQTLCQSVLDVPIATGTIQNIVDRASAAMQPVYQHIGDVARSTDCNYIDETSWFNENNLNWLWAMVNERVAFYRIDPHRSKEAFQHLVEDWQGILVSDGYRLYCNWVNDRQTCLAHMIRKADGLAERKRRDVNRFGRVIGAMLRQLIGFAHEKPSLQEWNRFYNILLFTLKLWSDNQDDAGRLARQMIREMDSLWTFLDHEGVEPTNNRAERALRFGVLWRKRSNGSQSEKGNRWVERILSLKETCRLRGKGTFSTLVDLITSYFNGSSPDLSWI